MSANCSLFVLSFAVATLLSQFAAAADWHVAEQPELEEAIKNAKPLEVEKLGVPVKTTRRGELMCAPNPDGKSFDLLQWYWPGYGGPSQAVIVDLGANKIDRVDIGRGRQLHLCGHAIGPKGKFWITTPDWRKGMCLYVYDPATNKLEARGVIVPDLTGERRPMTVSPDGKIFGAGSYRESSQAGLYEIDPETGKVTVLGPVGPSHAPGGVWTFSIVADERYVYVTSGQVPWYLVVYDRQTGEDRVLLTTEKVGAKINVWEGFSFTTRVRAKSPEPSSPSRRRRGRASWPASGRRTRRG